MLTLTARQLNEVHGDPDGKGSPGALGGGLGAGGGDRGGSGGGRHQLRKAAIAPLLMTRMQKGKFLISIYGIFIMP